MSGEQTVAELVAPDPDYDPRVVHLDECICPDGRHGAEGDTITLRAALEFAAVRTIRYAGQIAREEDPATSLTSLMAAMNEQFLLHGIESWTLVDGKGKPIVVEKETIRRYLLSNMTAAMIVGDAADVMYQSQVLHPLAVLAERSSRPMQTNGSISQQNGHGSKYQPPTAGSNGESSSHSGKRPKRSKRSSTTTTQTDSTEPISSDSAGGSTS